MTRIPQTNLQLYNQLIATGWDDAALARARRAYDLATELFAAQLRPSGKPFVAHVVGTAGVVAMFTDDRDAVLAALLHAAYTHGDFGDARVGIADRKRRELRAAIGAEAESLVAAYTRLGYSTAAIESWRRRAGLLTPNDRRLAMLRIANEVDDHLDLGTRYADRSGAAMSTDSTFEQLAVLAGEIGEPGLADLVTRVAAATSGVVVPPSLRSPIVRSSRVAPRSDRRRLAVVAASVVRRATGHARHLVARVRKLVPGS